MNAPCPRAQHFHELSCSMSPPAPAFLERHTPCDGHLSDGRAIRLHKWARLTQNKNTEPIMKNFKLSDVPHGVQVCTTQGSEPHYLKHSAFLSEISSSKGGDVFGLVCAKCPFTNVATEFSVTEILWQICILDLHIPFKISSWLTLHISYLTVPPPCR